MKHYIDIQNIREEAIRLDNDIVRQNNIDNFETGDFVVIQEKFDGSCASFSYDKGKLRAFSRKQELNYNRTLNGFWNYIQSLNPQDYEQESKNNTFIYFGEWTNKNKIRYDDKWSKHFLIFDIYEKQSRTWQPQYFVKEQCEKHGLNYIHSFYEGDFISWKHVKSFMNSPQYGDTQEGIVIKNQTKLMNNDTDNQRLPCYLKIVNDTFKESIKIKKRIVDPKKEEEKNKAFELIEQIVTRNRVEKMIHKLVDENLLSSVLTPSDMSTVAKLLPKRIYEDCLKEEKEVVMAAGEYAGKMISSITMQIARDMIIG